MFKKIQLFGCALMALAISANAQTKKIETVKKKGTEIVIPYEKYVLSNGLTVIVHEDHSDPIVHVDVTYHVGSAKEEIGKSGFAHFFEHMMFQGSDNVADEQHFKIVTESGGTLNGTTNRDRTNYFETLPSNQLETALWLEADRMGFLLDAVTQKKFEVQRETVKNERGQNYDNRPYGLSYENISKNLYPYGHPYSWMTIGYLEDLDRVDVNDLKNFFLRWYGPNNATLTVGGAVNPKEVVKLAEKYFGSIPRGPEVKNVKLPAPVLEKNRYVSYEDNYIRVPQLHMVFPTVDQNHPDKAALDCLADIIGQGKTSYLYKNFEKAQKALSSSAYNSTSELAGEFHFTVRPYPGTSLKVIEETIRKSIEEFEANGVTDEDLERFKGAYEARAINSLQSVSGKVSRLAFYETFTGSPNSITRDIKAYTSLTKEDVINAYNKYLKGKNAVILSVVPKGQKELAAAEDNYEINKDSYKAGKDEYSGLAYNKAKDKFDRSQRPKPGKNPIINVPAYWTENLANGIEVIGAKNDEIPTVTLLFTIKGGHLLEASVPEKSGVSSLMTSLMNESTQNFTSEELSSELNKIGSSISISSGGEEINIYVSSLVKHLDKTISLLEEKMFRPKFAADEFERIKKRQIESIKNSGTQPSYIASTVYNQLIYGKDNIKSIPSSGTTETVANITLDDVKAFYAKNFSPTVTNLVVVGDVNKDQIMPKLSFLNKWEKKAVTLPELKTNNKIEQTTIYLVNVDKAAQSEIRIGYLTNLTYDATGEYYKVGLMNYNLGGAFNSRINLNLREDKGYTYGARSGFGASRYPGVFTASAGVRANATDSSVVEFVKEITNYRNDGITAEELAFLKSSIGQRDARAYETPFQKANFLSNIIDYDLEKDFVSKQQRILSELTEKEIDALARKHLPIERMNIVVVGDAASIRPGLERLGYPIIELDSNGEPLKVAEEKSSLK
jgi:zinc protease